MARPHHAPEPARHALSRRLAVSFPLTTVSLHATIRIVHEDFRFLNEVFRIVTGALRLDLERVRNYTTFLADKLEAAGDVDSARRLKKLLAETDRELRPTGVRATARTLPVDSETRFPLLERVRPVDEPPVVLSDSQSGTLREFLSVAKSHAQLEVEGIDSAVSLLMYGPPGCGKSRLARHISSELGFELYVARLDGLISSYLGSTSKNIRALFDFTATTPCVLFLDEFDAIAKLRGDTQELGELKRVVNSFIQNLDTIGKQSVVIAATNHEKLLDAAIWRRFTYRIEVSYPTDNLRKALWPAFLSPLSFAHRDTRLLVDLSEGFSGSDIHEVCLRLHRQRVAEKTNPTMKDAFTAMLNIAMGAGSKQRLLSGFRSLDSRVIVRALRKRDTRLYSFAALGGLLGVSKATVFRWTTLKGVESDG